jgi:glycosyltransferase involved in cell wall biosynthesis
MQVTVAICTWNRSQLLDQTLARMADLRIPEGVTWDLLVVNNNCTDDTDAVLAKHQQRLPLRRLFEPRQGQSNARNCAMAVARGELLIWTDDDVLVDPDWLAEYVAAAGRWPDAAYFGGRIDPWFESTPPDWMVANRRQFEGLLVIRDLGGPERLFGEKEEPFGANMAFRQEVLRLWQFNPQLGRRGAEQIVGDETDLIGRVRARGHHGVWVPAARVQHYIPTARMSKAYLQDYFFAGGRMSVRLGARFEGKQWRGIPRWLYRRYVELRLRAGWQRLVRERDWMVTYLKAAQIRGIMHELRVRTATAAKT